MPSLLDPWNQSPHQGAMRAALERVATDACDVHRRSALGGAYPRDPVQVVAAFSDGTSLTVHFVFDVLIYHLAQSGSDWDVHHIHVGHAVFRGAELQTLNVTEQPGIHIAERGGKTDWYDCAPAMAEARAALAKTLAG